MMQQKLELTIRAEQDFSPWFNVVDYRPTIVGPYQMRTITENGNVVGVGMHWWNGDDWSRQLDYDPDIDVEIAEPPADHYVTYTSTDEWIADMAGAQWRGFNSDQAPDATEKMIAAELEEDEF